MVPLVRTLRQTASCGIRRPFPASPNGYGRERCSSSFCSRWLLQGRTIRWNRSNEIHRSSGTAREAVENVTSQIHVKGITAVATVNRAASAAAGQHLPQQIGSNLGGEALADDFSFRIARYPERRITPIMRRLESAASPARPSGASTASSPGVPFPRLGSSVRKMVPAVADV
jgi:hypothetical protein